MEMHVILYCQSEQQDRNFRQPNYYMAFLIPVFPKQGSADLWRFVRLWQGVRGKLLFPCWI